MRRDILLNHLRKILADPRHLLEFALFGESLKTWHLPPRFKLKAATEKPGWHSGCTNGRNEYRQGLVSENTGTQMLSENACRVLQTRYLRRGTRGEVIETPE